MASKPNALDRAVRCGLYAPLSNRQKATLAMLARTAWRKLAGATGEEFAEWRHEAQSAACGKASLRICTQADYKLINGYYQKLLGRPVDAFRAFVGAEGDGQKREIALAKAAHEVRRLVGLGKLPDEAAGRAYLNAILKDTAKGTLETASARQIWGAVMAMRKLGVVKKKGGRGLGCRLEGGGREQGAGSKEHGDCDRVGGDCRPNDAGPGVDTENGRSPIRRISRNLPGDSGGVGGERGAGSGEKEGVEP
jgi:hypothetical protein